MILYVKLYSYKNLDDIKRKVEEYGFSITNQIIDVSSIQKAPESTYENMKNSLLEGENSLVIDSLSSIGRDNREIANELEWYLKNEIGLIVLDLPATVKSPEYSLSLMKDIFHYLAEKEKTRVRKGQIDGLDKAKRENRTAGRKRIPYPDNWEELFSAWEKNEITAVEFIKRTGLKKGTFYNLVKQYKLYEADEIPKQA